MEAQNPVRAYRLLVADNHFEEELDPDPDMHKSVQLDPDPYPH